MTMNWLAAIAGAGLAVSQAAIADDVVERSETVQPATNRYAWTEPRLAASIGVGITLGGGISRFTDEQLRMRFDTGISGTWAARVTLGTHVPLALELGYTGARMGPLIGTSVEGALRWNLRPHAAFTPYTFAGVGWQRYDVREALSGMPGHDDITVFPIGGALAYRDTSGVTIEARATFRAATNSNLVTDRSGGPADLNSWEASSNVGYEF
jgi:hypothetical protein